MTSQEQINALSAAVISTDKSRRVGWARAYAAEGSRDNLARDVNMLRAERDIMRRAWSFMFGFFEVYAPSGMGALGAQLKAMGALLDPGAAKSGRYRARKQLEQDEERTRQRAVKEQLHKARMKDHGRDFRAARVRERRKLMETYGFPDEAAFLNYLELYASPEGREHA